MLYRQTYKQNTVFKKKFPQLGNKNSNLRSYGDPISSKPPHSPNLKLNWKIKNKEDPTIRLSLLLSTIAFQVQSAEWADSLGKPVSTSPPHTHTVRLSGTILEKSYPLYKSRKLTFFILQEIIIDKLKPHKQNSINLVIWMKTLAFLLLFLGFVVDQNGLKKCIVPTNVMEQDLTVGRFYEKRLQQKQVMAQLVKPLTLKSDTLVLFWEPTWQREETNSSW